MLALLLMPSERSIAISWAGVTLCSLEMMLLMGLPGMIRGRKKFSERAAHRVSRKKPARRMMNLIVVRGLSSLILAAFGEAVAVVAAAPRRAPLAPPFSGSRYDAGFVLCRSQPQPRYMGS